MAKSPNKVSRPTILDTGIDQAYLIDVLRDWLTRGVSKTNLASSVRVKDFQPYSGGLKAKKVGELSLDLKVTIKVGSEELVGHQTMMNFTNQKNEALKTGGASLLQDRIFPEVMSVAAIPREFAGDGLQFLMLMQSLAGYLSLEDALYEQDALTIPELERVVNVALNMLEVIHNIRPGDEDLTGISITPSPFQSRIDAYLKQYFLDDIELAVMNVKPGHVNGKKCPPLREVLDSIQWPTADVHRLSLIHGDCHLANIMLRRRGKNLSVRLIDPNPRVGYSLPVYDYGKLYHFADPVGWARRKKSFCAGEFVCGRKTWSLNYEVRGTPAGIEKKRAHLVSFLDDKMSSVDSSEMSISRAAAHVALAQLYAKENPSRGRYCLGETIKHLLAASR